jgi:DNA-binding LytR/AlgR family response regulator
MNVLIIEDELPARAKLESMLQALDKTIHIAGKLGSVKEALSWLNDHDEPDLALVDIQLSDDHSFEIFRKHPVQFPVIFTTAYDKYLLESFEFNSIDYLLKPITEEKLGRALDKVKRLQRHFQNNLQDLVDPKPKIRDRIVARKGTEFIALATDDIAYFYTEHKVIFLKDFSGRQLMVDKNLGQLESDLNTTKFFRLNRKYIVNMKAVERFKSDQGKIRVFLTPETKDEVHVSKEAAPEFRKWIGDH